MSPRRVMIIGGPGSGKTWLAQRLGESLGLPVIAIDDFLRDENGQQRFENAIDNDAIEATLKHEWVIEGGNSRTYEARLDRAGWLIRLRPPVMLRLWRVLRRGNATQGLLRWTLDYDRVFGPRDDAVVMRIKGQTRLSDLRSRQDVGELLQSLPC